MSWVGWRCQRCRHEFRHNQRFCPSCAYTVYDPIHGHERPDWATPDVAARVRYLDAVLAELPDEWRPDRREDEGRFINPGVDNSLHTGFRVAWNQPDMWPYGVVLRWTAPSGWLFCEPMHTLQQLVDELVPYPELVAVGIGRLLNDGPATFPITGATRWPDAGALTTELDTTP